jgi:environmental stress-induced protein Ves
MSAEIRVLRAAGHVTMPWKNGGGVTTEIAVHPAGASLETFLWRISMAHVASDGPFSRFDGVDRTLVLLDGHGMRLDIEDRTPVTLVEGSDPLPFPADVPTSAHLLDGPIRDLNVMTRRGQWRHAVERIAIQDGGTWTAAAPVSVILCGSNAVAIETAGGKHVLNRDDAVIMETASAINLVLLPSGASQLFAISFWPAANA